MALKMYSGLQKIVKAVGGDDPVGQVATYVGVSRGTLLRWLREDGTPVGAAPEIADNAVGRAITAAGSQTALATVLGVSYQAVASWHRMGYVPARRAQQIEAEYGIPRGELLSPKLRSAMGLGGEL